MYAAPKCLTLNLATCLARYTAEQSGSVWKHQSFASRALLPALKGRPPGYTVPNETRWQGGCSLFWLCAKCCWVSCRIPSARCILIVWSMSHQGPISHLFCPDPFLAAEPCCDRAGAEPAQARPLRHRRCASAGARCLSRRSSSCPPGGVVRWRRGLF